MATGKPLKLTDYRGKVVLLVFWGTWCGPCMEAVKHERALAERLKGRPFSILGIDCDEDKELALKTMKENDISWPNWNDGEPGAGPIAKRWHVQGFPTMILIGPDGTIRHKQVPPTEEHMNKLVNELLDEIARK